MRPLRRAPEGGRDPAPSRLAYRAERLWLTPLFKALVRTGLPAFSVVIAVTWYIGDPVRLEAIVNSAAQVRQQIEDRPEFMVKLMTIEGASPELSEDIREVLPIDLPISQFALELEQIKDTLEALDPVEVADVRIKPGGLLTLTIEERRPAILWRHDEGLEVLAYDGHRVSSAMARTQYATLPHIAGEGADLFVPEALRLYSAASPIADQIKGLQRIGARRWDMVLTNGTRIMLPEQDPGLALDRALALHAAQNVLSRDVTHLDYRNGHRPVVRMTDAARKEWRRIKDIELIAGEDNTR